MGDVVQSSMPSNRAFLQIAVLVMVGALSVGLRQAVPVQAIAGGYDDMLFIRLAESICRGEWLGPYDNLTLAKGAGYPAFLCASAWIGLPLRVSEALLYLLACAVASAALGDLSKRRWLSIITFTALALIPIFWGVDLSRVIRENIYISLSLLVVSCGALAFTVDRGTDRGFRRRLPALVGLGVSAGAYWLTREETPWLYPAVGVLMLHWLVSRCLSIRRTGRLLSRQSLAAVMLPILVPAAIASGMILGVCALNLSFYGAFRDNEYRQGPFADAYGAISRIEYKTPWKRYLAFPEDARTAAYAVSPTAAELKPFLEGPKGASYMSPGFGSYDTTGFMWVLRDAVADLGHYQSAAKADAFYRRLASEINAGCDQGVIPCLPGRGGTFMPPSHAGQLGEALHSAYDFFWKAAGFQSGPVGARPSIGDEATIQRFAAMIHSPPAPLEQGTASAALRSVSGWVYAPKGSLIVGADPVSAPVTLDLRPAGDVLAHFGKSDAAALRFRAIGMSSASISINQGASVVRLPLSAQPGSMTENEEGVMLHVDEATPAQPAAELTGGSPASTAVTALYRAVGPWLVPLSLAWLGLVTLWSCLRRRWPDSLLAFSLAVAGAFITRIALVSFLNVTALRSDYHYLYVSPAAPFGILVVACAAAVLWREIDARRTA